MACAGTGWEKLLIYDHWTPMSPDTPLLYNRPVQWVEGRLREKLCINATEVGNVSS